MTRDELIEVMVAAVQGHDYDVRANGDWANLCTGCDWAAVGPMELYDEHRAELALDAVEHLIRADALRQAAEAFGENQMIREGDAKEWLNLRADRIERGES